MTSPIAVLGAGSWGTALAIQLARNQQPVQLWGNNAARIKAMQQARCNFYYLPEIILPAQLSLHSELETALAEVHDILISVPSHAFRATLLKLKPYLTAQSRVVWATKGLDPHHHQLLHEVAQAILGDLPTAVLSGPSFAREVAQALPTAITLASRSAEFIAALMARLHTETFRIYHTDDLIGVQLGGAMKNALAIAVGISDGLGFGANARAALITRGLTEMVRLGLVLGGSRETLMGLAGLGDLVLTCTDNQSRNRRLGLALGNNKTLAAAREEIQQVIEGIQTAQEIYSLAQQHHVEVPITTQVYKILYQDLSPQTAVTELLAREPRAEGI